MLNTWEELKSFAFGIDLPNVVQSWSCDETRRATIHCVVWRAKSTAGNPIAQLTSHALNQISKKPSTNPRAPNVATPLTKKDIWPLSKNAKSSGENRSGII